MRDEQGISVLIYGAGGFFFEKKKNLAKIYNIVGIVDAYKKNEEVDGEEIISPDCICNYHFQKVIIMIKSIFEQIRIINTLVKEKGIKTDDIILGVDIFEESSEVHIESMIECFDTILYKIKAFDATLCISSPSELGNAYEVLGKLTWNYHLPDELPEIVFDVGANIGSASVFFGKRERVEKVFAYEPLKGTYEKAIKTVDENGLSGKISIFNFGLGDRNEYVQVTSNEELSTSLTTNNRFSDYMINKAVSEGIISYRDVKYEQVEVKNVSEVFFNLIKDNNYSYILKLDCEGAEYGIIQCLSEKDMLRKFRVVMMEIHYDGTERIENILDKNGFRYICTKIAVDLWMIYAFQG